MEQVILMMLATGAVSVILGIILKRSDVPPIVGYILSGIILVNVIGSNLENSHVLEQIAEFGIVFLMFTLGLEFSIPRLIAAKRILLGVGGLQVLICTLVATCVAWLLGYNLIQSIVVGGALALSSTAVVVKQLTEQKKQSTFANIIKL